MHDSDRSRPNAVNLGKGESTDAIAVALAMCFHHSRQAKALLSTFAALSDLQVRKLSAGDFLVPIDQPFCYTDKDVRNSNRTAIGFAQRLSLTAMARRLHKDKWKRISGRH